MYYQDNIERDNCIFRKLLISSPLLFPNTLGIDKIIQSDNNIPKYIQIDISITSTNTYDFNIIFQKIKLKLSFQLHWWQVDTILEIFNRANIVVSANIYFKKSLFF